MGIKEGIIYLLIIIWAIHRIIIENFKEKPIDWWTIKRGIIYGILLALFILTINCFVS